MLSSRAVTDLSLLFSFFDINICSFGTLLPIPININGILIYKAGKYIVNSLKTKLICKNIVQKYNLQS